MKISLFNPNLGPLEKEYLNDALLSGWIGGKGEYVDEFEAEFAKYIGVRHAITTSSGTTALILAYQACGMKGDSKVIAPNQTFAATYDMATVFSQKVSLIKSQPDTWNLNPDSVDADYFIGVHLYGNPIDMGALYRMKPTFIEDCAQSIGSEYKGKKCGSFGKASIFSFHAAKTITAGEGGMVCTNDDEVSKKVRHLKSHCMIKPYEHDAQGWNFRMTNLQAAIGLAQLERIEELLSRKRAITKMYDDGLDKRYIRQANTRKCNVVKWANAYRNDYAGLIRQKLEADGIETRPGFNRADIVVLPSGTTLTNEEVQHVISCANKAVT